MEGYFIETAPDQCPNCEAELMSNAQYCQVCGQRKRNGRITFRALLAEFFELVFNLESRFFRSLLALWVPGKLTIAFFQGRYQRYYRPMRLFFLMAIVHFAVIAHLVNEKTEAWLSDQQNQFREAAFRFAFLQELDTLQQEIIPYFTREQTAMLAIDSIATRLGKEKVNSTIVQYPDWSNGGLTFRQLKLSYQAAFVDPVDEVLNQNEITQKRTRFLLGQIMRVMRNPGRLLIFTIGNLTWMILLMMPALAFLLKLLYLRRDFYFVEHLVFSFHYHAFAFMIASPAYLLYQIWPMSPAIALIGIAIYLFWAMRRVYGQGVVKTGIKFYLLNSLYGVIFFIFLTFMVLVSTLVF